MRMMLRACCERKSRKKTVSGNRAFILLEVLIGLSLIAMLLSFAVPIVQQQLSLHQKQLQYAQGQAFVAGFKDNIQAQWQKLRWQGCHQWDTGYIEIGQGKASAPDRIKNKSLPLQSDWLSAYEMGQCAASLQLAGEETVWLTNCSLDVGQAVLFAGCSDAAMGTVQSIYQNNVILAFPETLQNNENKWPSGSVISLEPFVWYLARGKNGQTAFWRTPIISGNSLELWSGVGYLAVYPMVDHDSDGRVDELSTVYGHYPVATVKGVWVEIIVTLEGCLSQSQGEQTYMTLRQQIWTYDPQCAFPMDFMVAFDE
jgi:type II secretory pathway pseudopilin PulG